MTTMTQKVESGRRKLRLQRGQKENIYRTEHRQLSGIVGHCVLERGVRVGLDQWICTTKHAKKQRKEVESVPSLWSRHKVRSK